MPTYSATKETYGLTKKIVGRWSITPRDLPKGKWITVGRHTTFEKMVAHMPDDTLYIIATDYGHLGKYYSWTGLGQPVKVTYKAPIYADRNEIIDGAFQYDITAFFIKPY